MRIERCSPARRWLPQVLVFFLVIPPSAYSQQAAPQQATPQAAPQPATPLPTQPMAPLPTVQNLKVITLAGKGEMNDLERHVMALLVVQVLDPNDRPVEGAEVVFRFPLEGPSATFANQKTSQTARTNSQGQAGATGWTANDKVGSFEVHATASYGNQMGETTIPMTNVTRIVEDVKKRRKDKPWYSTRKFKIAVIAGAAAGAAVGIILATRDSKSTVTISPGSPSVGGPQ
jgi:hypothetical protein